MKVTKNILRELVEVELLKERVGQRFDILFDKAQINRLARQIGNNQSSFNRQWRNEFMNLNPTDFSNENYGQLLQDTLNDAVEAGYLEGSDGVFSLSSGRTSAGTVNLDTSPTIETPVQTGEVNDSDISLLDYLANGGSVLKFGSSGSKVTALQNILNARLQSHGMGDQLIEVTGTFDSATQAAVETMQGVYGLQVDGIVGRQTWIALKSDGAEQAAVTPRAETAPASGVATAEEEEAAAAAAAAATATAAAVTVRTAKPGPIFLWDQALSVWYAFHNHYYFDETPDEPVYQLWIVKDDEDFHVKMDSGDIWSSVTQSDIDSLVTSTPPTPSPATLTTATATSGPVVPEIRTLASLMLLEFNAATTKTNNNTKNTTRANVGNGAVIKSFDELKEEIDKDILDFNNAIRPIAQLLKREAAKGFWSNSDEDGSLEGLEEFATLASDLYVTVSETVFAIKINFTNKLKDVDSLKNSPSLMLSRLGSFDTIENMVEKLDDYLAGENFIRMETIIQANSASIEDRQSTVLIVNSGNDVDEINQLNDNLLVLQSQIKNTAKIIAANSYDKRTTYAGMANMAASAAFLALDVATLGGSAVVRGAARGALGASRAARAANVAGDTAAVARTAGLAGDTAALARTADVAGDTSRVVGNAADSLLATRAVAPANNIVGMTDNITNALRSSIAGGSGSVAATKLAVSQSDLPRHIKNAFAIAPDVANARGSVGSLSRALMEIGDPVVMAKLYDKSSPELVNKALHGLFKRSANAGSTNDFLRGMRTIGNQSDAGLALGRWAENTDDFNKLVHTMGGANVASALPHLDDVAEVTAVVSKISDTATGLKFGSLFKWMSRNKTKAESRGLLRRAAAFTRIDRVTIRQLVVVSGYAAARGYSTHIATDPERDSRREALAANNSVQMPDQGDSATERYLASKGMMDTAGNVLAAVAGVDAFGDGADEELVVAVLEDFNIISQSFYESSSELIVKNNIVLETPTAMLFKEYNFEVTVDDKATSIEGMIGELDEFLEGSNLDNAKAYIRDNNILYDEFIRVFQNLPESRTIKTNDSFTFDRFSKLAGILKG